MIGTRPTVTAVLGIATAVVLSGCSFFQEARTVVVTGGHGLRTFTLAPRGEHVMCLTYASLHPVVGILRAEPPGSREPVRLEVSEGHRVSVVWPEGFTVTFEPDLVMRDQANRAVAHEGDRVKLDQTPFDEATGTWDDPYVAHGLTLGDCYPYLP